MASPGDDAGRNVVGIDPTEVAEWTEQLGIAFTGALSFERIGLGQSNLTFLVRDGQDRKWVLRRPPLGELLASAHDVGREARNQRARRIPGPRRDGADYLAETGRDAATLKYWHALGLWKIAVIAEGVMLRTMEVP